ncbi:MAG: hypothetical protein ABI586_11905, partial [Candidatus Nanopelagicales bacterium]
VLIPMWLRGHDSAVENRSADRFGQAMRVLARRSDDEDEIPREDEANGRAEDVPQTYIDAYGAEVPVSASEQRAERPPRQEPRRKSSPKKPRTARVVAAVVRRSVLTVKSRMAARSAKVASPSKAVRAKQKSRPSLAHRRARTLLVLLGFVVVCLLAALVGVFPAWAPLPFVVLLVAFVVHLRGQAKRMEALRARRSPGTSDEQHEASPAEAIEEVLEEAVAQPQRRRFTSRAAFVQGPSRAMVVETKGARDDAVTVEDDGEAWRPNPLPLPTYVTAPKAVRPIKVIDLTTPGAWSSGRLIDDDAIADEDALAADIAENELDAMLEHEAKGRDGDDASRRAVGD